MKNDYPHIFSPLTVKNMTIKNRIVMMPMGTNYGEQNGEMSFLHINYYEQRAKGGTGLIIVENASVDSPQGSNGTTQLRIDHDNYLPRLFKFCENIHRYGTKIAIQINHAGASAVSSRINMQPVSASDVPSKEGGEIPRPLSKDEILHIVKKYGEAAKRAQTAGFDAVEIHAGHSYLISQFLSPITNKRTDEFGGSVENRTRFCRMVIDEVRKQVGPFFPIMLRLSADELMEGGNTLEDTLEYLDYLQEEVDIFDVSCGLNGSIQYQIDANYLPDGWRSYMAKAVKEKFNKPCISMGNVRDPKVAERILADGDADLIGMGRGLIADPAWVNKVATGHECDLRKCISCNVGCAGNRIGVNRPIRCTVNPSVLEGDVYKKQHVNKNCNVVVIGGGTAAYYLAQQLISIGVSVKIIEQDRKRCESLSILLPKAIIINGDGTDQSLLEEEGIRQTEAFIPLTGIDEENVMLTLYARQVSSAKVVTKINRITFKNVLNTLDLGSVVYPKYMAAEAIIAYVRAKNASQHSEVETLYHMFDSKAEAVEFIVKEHSEITDIPLKDLQLKDNLLVSLICRNGTIIFPSGADCIKVGDTVMIVTTHSGFSSIQDILK